MSNQTKQKANDYDYLIVGAGLAGLHCALRLKKGNPKASVAIAEAYNYVGGRIYTYTPKDYPNIHWESGAGRIHESHTMVKAYLKAYGLTRIPISSTTEYRSSQDPSFPRSDTWTGLSQYLVSTLSSLTSNVLATHSIRELLVKLQGKAKTDALLSHFSYRAEMDVMRADLALESIKREMGPSTDFFVVKEGLGALAKAMKEEAESLGVEFLMGHRLKSVKSKEARFVVADESNQPHRKSLRADHIILALHNKALRAISPFKTHPLLHKIIMCPLLRIYGIFDTPWFSGLPKTVTDGPLRFVIPISERNGTIMVSYTDASDTQYWSSMSEKKLHTEILKELRRLFPEREIPPPLYLKTHLWNAGCSYWAPGKYDPEEASRQILNPMPHIYVCGESWSLKQAWLEGALEHAELLCKTYLLST